MPVCPPRDRVERLLTLCDTLLGQFKDETEGVVGLDLKGVMACAMEQWAVSTAALPVPAAVTSAEFLRALEDDEVTAFEALSIVEGLAVAAAFQIDEDPKASGRGHYPVMATQFMLDGLDAWLDKLPVKATDGICVALGLSPKEIARVRSENPQRLNDYICTIVFPENVDEATGGADWLCSEDGNRRLPKIALDDEASPEKAKAKPNKGKDAKSKAAQAPKRGRAAKDASEGSPAPVPTPDTEPSAKVVKKETAASEAAPDDGVISVASGDSSLSLTVTPDNVKRFMAEAPDNLPHDVKKAHRRPVAKGITEFELENHYLVSELKTWAKEQGMDKGAQRAKKAALVKQILSKLDEA